MHERNLKENISPGFIYKETNGKELCKLLVFYHPETNCNPIVNYLLNHY